MTPTEGWGRFTARGGDEVEALCRSIVAHAVAVMERVVGRESFRAIVMLGGYGRGEGGVEVGPRGERPHNNFDFLIITTLRAPRDHGRLKRAVDHALAPIAAAHGVGLDVGVVGAWKLRTSPCLVMWYDMRFGHKTLAGDASFVPSLRRFSRSAIVPSDVRDLLVNRGTLLVIDDLLLARGGLDDGGRRAVVKHAMKAIIGYGDAFLFTVGDYDWSYLAKQRRMRAREDAPEALRVAYDEAVEFRLRPSYERFEGRDLGAWLDGLRGPLADVHLRFERLRLGRPGIDWSDYARSAILRDATRSLDSARGLARAARGLARPRGARASARGPRLALAARVLGARGVLPLLFPTVAYPSAGGDRALARDLLGASSTSPDALRRAYLRAWGEVLDLNFSAVVAKLGIDLQEERT